MKTIINLPLGQHEFYWSDKNRLQTILQCALRSTSLVSTHHEGRPIQYNTSSYDLNELNAFKRVQWIHPYNILAPTLCYLCVRVYIQKVHWPENSLSLLFIFFSLKSWRLFSTLLNDSGCGLCAVVFCDKVFSGTLFMISEIHADRNSFAQQLVANKLELAPLLEWNSNFWIALRIFSPRRQ